MAGIDGAHISPFLAHVEAARGFMARAADALEPLATAGTKPLERSADLLDGAAMNLDFFAGELRDSRSQVTTYAAAEAARTLAASRTRDLGEALSVLRDQIHADGDALSAPTMERVQKLQVEMREVTGKMLDDVVRKASAPGPADEARLGAEMDGVWVGLDERMDSELGDISVEMRRRGDRAIDDAEEIVANTPPPPGSQTTLDDGTIVQKGNIYDPPSHLSSDPEAHFARQLAEYDGDLGGLLETQTPRLSGPDRVRAHAAEAWATVEPSTTAPRGHTDIVMAGSAPASDEPIAAGERLYTAISDNDRRGPGGEMVRYAKSDSFMVPDLDGFIKLTEQSPRTRWAVAPRESGGWNVVELDTPTKAMVEGTVVPATAISPTMRAVRMEARAFDGIVTEGVFMRFSDAPGTVRSDPANDVSATAAGRAIDELRKSLGGSLKPKVPTDEELLAPFETRWIADWITVPQPGERAGRLVINTDVMNMQPDQVGPAYDIPLTYAPGDVSIVHGTREEAADQINAAGLSALIRIDKGTWGIAPVSFPGQGRSMTRDLALNLLRGSVQDAGGIDGIFVRDSIFFSELT